MLKYLIFSWVLLAITMDVRSQIPTPITHSKETSIIPSPAKIVYEDVRSEIKSLIFPNNLPIDKKFLNTLFTYGKYSFVQSKKKVNVILPSQKDMAPSSYKLIIGKKRIEILASDNNGFQYALVSLAQIVQFEGFPLQCRTIEDNPAFVYRGMHLDVARHFFTVAEVKKYLDYMAYYKFNHFHWHLTDDQGWRIEIKKYPKLQEHAAYRNETLIGHYNDQPHKFDGVKYGGYYTQDEIKEVVLYAADRNITVIPEIEMPGHALAALAAYPELGCEVKKYETATKWGVFEDVFCPYDTTFRFLEGVIDEVVSLFPGKYIHIGGDECPKDSWRKSEFCQQLIKDNNLKDEHELQSYFIKKMEKYINGKGKQIIGWDEILEGGLSPNATVMSWRGVQGGIDAATLHHDVIMTPGSHCYFDYYQSENPTEPLAIGGLTTIDKVYHWNPIPESLAAENHKYILGGQSNLWSEYIHNYSGVEYMVYARGMAMSEALWSTSKNYDGFLSRFERHADFWKSKGAKVAMHIYDIKPRFKAGTGKGVELSFVTPKDANVVCTRPDQKSENLSIGSSIKIDQSGTYTFKAIKGNREGRALKLDFDLHKATQATIILDKSPSKPYEGQGPASVINGVQGSNAKYGGSEWLGFSGNDASGTIDLGKNTSINELKFRFFKGEGQWIYLPKSLEIEFSSNGEKADTTLVINDIKSDTKVAEVIVNAGVNETRFIKFRARNYGIIPEGAQGSGHPAWLFIDEITVR